MKVQFVLRGSKAENLTGKHPAVLARGEWYGQFVHLYERIKDGKLFCVYPAGMTEKARENFVNQHIVDYSNNS